MLPLAVKEEGGCLKVVPLAHAQGPLSPRKRRVASWLRRFFRCRKEA